MRARGIRKKGAGIEIKDPEAVSGLTELNSLPPARYDRSFPVQSFARASRRPSRAARPARNTSPSCDDRHHLFHKRLAEACCSRRDIFFQFGSPQHQNSQAFRTALVGRAKASFAKAASRDLPLAIVPRIFDIAYAQRWHASGPPLFGYCRLRNIGKMPSLAADQTRKEQSLFGGRIK